jgi:hypothetical protein
MGRLRVNSGMVVHETIDGETILIHMGTGTYYSVDGAGSDIWNLAAVGNPEPAIATEIAGRYQIDVELAARSVSALVAELLEEELLRSTQDEEVQPLELSDPSNAFAEPVLHKYTDMQEFMLVDPLHDVDPAAGWPHAAPG